MFQWCWAWSDPTTQEARQSQTAHLLQKLSPPSLHRCRIEQQFRERNIRIVKCDESAGKPTIRYATRDSDTCFTKTSGQAIYRLVPSDLAACTNHRVKQWKKHRLCSQLTHLLCLVDADILEPGKRGKTRSNDCISWILWNLR